MSSKSTIAEALRYLLLPIYVETEDACTNAAASILHAAKILEEEHADFIKLKFDEWRQGHTVNAVLRKVITEIINVSDKDHGRTLSENYFKIFDSLRAEGLPFDLVVILLSQLRLIASLASRERMSSAKIALMLTTIDHRLQGVTWKNVQSILAKIGLEPQVPQGLAEKTYSQDYKSSDEAFADASITDASFMVGVVGERLGFPGRLQDLLDKLTEDGSIHIPYLQILHFQALVSAFYDHRVTVPYEFAPRGLVANWLFAKWDKLTATSNPILNNAKAVDVLDRNWANGRKANEAPQANALVDILIGIDGMGYSASQELSSWIRKWLMKFIRINEVSILPIQNLSLEAAKKIVNQISIAPTKTYGILEQRVVDAYANLTFPISSGWRQRGTGDSVNTNNLSRRKLGDCDFQNVQTKTVEAFEAHGGILTEIYYEGHIRTLTRSLNARAEELIGIADASEWKIRITFIAYGFKVHLPEPFEINGFNVIVQFLTFQKMQKTMPLITENLFAFNKIFLGPLNERRTPETARATLRTLIG